MQDSNTGLSNTAPQIAAMTESEVTRFIRKQSRQGRLSLTVRVLNEQSFSADADSRAIAEAAIRKLGFI